jgi:hypothetical protein
MREPEEPFHSRHRSVLELLSHFGNQWETVRTKGNLSPRIRESLGWAVDIFSGHLDVWRAAAPIQVYLRAEIILLSA